MPVHLSTALGILVLWVITHPSTFQAQRCLTLLMKRGNRFVQRDKPPNMQVCIGPLARGLIKDADYSNSAKKEVARNRTSCLRGDK
jgi:hypothetical protein